MRVILMHNPKAGRGTHAKRELMAALAKAGHHAIYRSTGQSNYEKALEKPSDLVLAAGGDGTVEKICCELIDTGMPFSVLPLGTANNLARSLGFTAPPEEIIAGLRNGTRRAFDVGVAHWPWRQRYFFEGAGGGLLADYLNNPSAKTKNAKKLSRKQELTRHISRLRAMLHDSPVQEWKMEIDGEDISDRYALWEAMNIRSIGPALHLASSAATRDGQLDFVCVRKGDRRVLLEYLDARLAGLKTKFPLPLRRFGKLKVIWQDSILHFDGKVWPRKNQKPKSPCEIEITVKPSALIVVRPCKNVSG